MLATGHEAEGGVDPAGRERAERQRRERALIDQPGDFRQQIAGLRFVAGENRVHGDDVERGIPAQSPQRDARVHVNVAFADFEETAGFGEAGEAHRDRFGGERVEDDIHAAAVGEFHDGLREIAAAGVDDVFDAERFEQGALGRATGGGDDLGTEMMGDLDRGHADTTGTGVDENAFARFHPGDVVQRIPRGHEDHRQRRGFLVGKIFRHLPHVGGAGQRVGREAENRETERLVADGQMRDAFADCHDLARHFVAEDPRVGGFGGIERERLEHVAEVHAGGFDLDQHFARARRPAARTA